MRPLLFIIFGCATALITPAPALAATVSRQQQSDTARKDPARTPQSLDAIRITTRREKQGYAAPRSSSASRTGLDLRDTPRAVTVVTRQLIADQAMQSMADVALYVPGVSMGSGEGHRDAPTIRGISSTADFFLDGVRDDAQYLRDLYNVERVEVLKGPEALLFGRGGGGGLINRITRQATWSPTGSITTEGGSFEHARMVLDAGQPISATMAGRIDGMLEHSGGFRDAAWLRRFGVNPTVAMMAGSHTMVRAGYEVFDDRRRVDRGIPSYRGAPLDADATTFFGNPSVNAASSRVNIASASVERQGDNGLTLRNRLSWADYDKFYQNTLPGVVDAGGTRVSLSAYNHAVARRNVLNAADAVYGFSTGSVRHALLAGVDLSRQQTGQVRLTGYFNDSSATLSAPVASPTVTTPVVFRASATDADNRTIATAASAYVQEQVTLSPALLLIGGARLERFGIDYHNNRTGQELSRIDRMLSPRFGAVFKPATTLSLYASYGVSHLPGSGDQFTSLTVTTSTLEPERFTNREAGAKWDVRPDLFLTGAVYRIDRTNTLSPDPTNSGLVVQSGAQRTDGWELGVTGSPARGWQAVAGIGGQRARIMSATTAARAGAGVPLVPLTSVSFWNRVQLSPALGIGLGVVGQSRAYAAIDNTVTLPGFTRADAALYARILPRLQAQVNVENLLGTRYFATTQGNNNIMPGAPRSLRISATVTR